MTKPKFNQDADSLDQDLPNPIFPELFFLFLLHITLIFSIETESSQLKNKKIVLLLKDLVFDKIFFRFPSVLSDKSPTLL